MVWLFYLSALFFIGSAAAWWLWHWLIIITEGVFLGPKLVVWLYDREAFRYDSIKAYAMEDELILLVEPILGELQGKQSPSVLDVATGTGRVPLFLFEDGRFLNSLNGRFVGLDASRKMLDFGIKNLAESAQGSAANWVLGSAANLTFADAEFDVVTCLESLEFFPELERAINEMIRVLKPDGSLLITRRAGWEAKWFLGRYYSQEAFTKMLREKGLTDVILYQWQNNYDLAIGRKPKIDKGV